jgi:hypothetical protein
LLIHICLDIPQSFLDRTQPKPSASDTPEEASTAGVDSLSASPKFFCPSGAFQGWKQFKLAAKRQSESSGDLKRLTSLRDEWMWDTTNEESNSKMEETSMSAFRKVSMEDMPYEILGMTMMSSCAK